MDDLLFLVHRIPYPPNKGDKIRSFRLLEYLSRSYRIHLGTFIDQPSDRRYCDVVRQYCATTWFGTLSPAWAKAKSLIGLVTGEALTLPYYRQRGLARWICALRHQHDIRHVLIYSGAMAQYVLGREFDGMHRIIDFVDVDSEKWRQYSTLKKFPMNWVYRREAERLGEFERRVATTFAASLFVSQQEVAVFRRELGETPSFVVSMGNGVDSDYFAPDPTRPSPFADPVPPCVFTGAMDYWANEEGVTWFAQHILPKLRRHIPQIGFYIVGMNPTASVCQLERLPGVTVTGGVPDIRPYLQHAGVVVVPLRIARGIQNKVLEAMAMGRPVVATPQALEGINAQVEREILVAETSDEFTRQVLQAWGGQCDDIAHSARAFVQREFAWETKLPLLTQLLTM